MRLDYKSSRFAIECYAVVPYKPPNSDSKVEMFIYFLFQFISIIISINKIQLPDFIDRFIN